MSIAALGWIGPPFIGALASPWMAQAWGTLSATLVLLGILGAWRAVAMLSLPLAAMSLQVLPVLLPSGPAAPARTLRIAYANVNAWNAPSQDAVEWFSSTGADVVAMIECSAQWADALRGLREAEGPRWPHVAIRTDGHPMSGVALLSRHPLREVQSFTGPAGRFPMVDAIVEAPEGAVRIILAHPVPPVSALSVETRNAEIGWLAQRCAESAIPTAIVADFNDTPFGRALREFAARSGMRSAASVRGLVTTWPARVGGMAWPAPLRIAIDHCFVSRDIGVASLAAGPDIGSDHLPLLIDIRHGEPAAPR